MRIQCLPPLVIRFCQSTLLTCLLRPCKTWWKMNHQFDLLFLQNCDWNLETVVPKTSESLKKEMEIHKIILQTHYSTFEITTQTQPVSSLQQTGMNFINLFIFYCINDQLEILWLHHSCLCNSETSKDDPTIEAAF